MPRPDSAVARGGLLMASGSSAGLVLAIHEGECLPVVVADDEARRSLFDDPWRWEAVASVTHFTALCPLPVMRLPVQSSPLRVVRLGASGFSIFEPTVTATAHLQVGFRKGSPTSDANPRGEETCNVNFGSLSIVESVDLKLCVSRYSDRFRPNCE